MPKGQDLNVKGVATKDNIPQESKLLRSTVLVWLTISSLNFEIYCSLMKLGNSTGTPESSETGDGDFQQRLGSPHSDVDQRSVEG